jgi:hypothetical protein
MINTKLLRSKILVAITLGFSGYILYRCLSAAIFGYFFPIDYWLYGILGLLGCTLAILKKKWARFCILSFYALQVFFIKTKLITIYYHVGFYYARHVSRVEPDLSEFPPRGVTYNIVGIALFVIASMLSASNKYSGNEAAYDWQCPECGNNNDGSLIKCKCGYEDEEV